ncbi:hypothetical protein [Antribacter gilvus]|uniref:hypothetical protein n=1 Tax=Antribacter gilvus TaxID=2304675 RepID=UPI000F796CE3|nr:hypothetical protein [Antribacter gilvus]
MNQGGVRLEDAGTSGIDLTDTHGVSVWDFTLQFDTGSGFFALPDVTAEIYGTLTRLFWGWYQNIVSVQVWVLDWVLGMDWLNFILAPLAGISMIVQSMVAQIGILSLTLIILAFVVGYWLLKGRYAGGFMELLIGCVIAALATGFLANPMATIAGPNGVIMQSRDAGMDIATGFATDGASFRENADAIRSGLKGQLVDTLVRTPHQILNYGAVIDGTSCEGVYTQNVGKDNAAETIGGCNPQYAEAASAITEGTVIASISLLSSAFVFLLLSVVIVGGTIFAVLLLGWSAIKLLWQLPVGVVSSDTRGSLFKTFASVGLGCFLVAIATVFLVAWMKMLLGFYGATNGLPFLVRLYLFNTVVIAGAVGYVVAGASVRKGLKTIAERLAAMGPNPSKVPPPAKINWEAPEKWGKNYDKVKGYLGVGLGPKPVAEAATSAAGGAAASNAMEAIDAAPRTMQDAAGRAVGAAARGVGSGSAGSGSGALGSAGPTAELPRVGALDGTPASLTAGAAFASGPTIAAPPSPRASDRISQRLGRAARTAGNVAIDVAAGTATGGTSAAVTGSRALANTRRVARAAKTVRDAGRIAGMDRQTRTGSRVRAELDAALREGGAVVHGADAERQLRRQQAREYRR